MTEEVEAVAGPQFFRADQPFDATDFAAGVYTIRAAIVVDDKPLGGVAAVVRKR